MIDGAGRFVDSGPLIDESAGIEREFVEPLVEVKTSPCESTAQLAEELYSRLETALERADEHGLGLVPLATPITHEEIRELPTDRTRIQNLVVGDTYRYARCCAGTHVHIEQIPGRETEQLNTLIALDPALALVNSSPYFDGRPLVTGARSKLYRDMINHHVPDQRRLWPYLSDRAEWDSILESGFEAFIAAATSAGVSRKRVHDNFDPESAVWTPVKLRATLGTIEWRSPDTTLPSQVVRLADELTEVTEHLADAELRIEGRRGSVTDERVVLPAFDALMEYVTAAISEGLESPPVRSYLDRMGFTVDAYQPISAEIGGRDRVSASDARALRLEYAEQLDSEVRGSPERVQ